MNTQLSASTAAQRSRLLAALRNGPVSTIKARHELDIMMPAARIHELRHKDGMEIITQWCKELNPEGGEHRVAYYVLQNSKPKQRRGKCKKH